LCDTERYRYGFWYWIVAGSSSSASFAQQRKKLTKEKKKPKAKTLPQTTQFPEGELQAQRLRAKGNCAREQHLRSLLQLAKTMTTAAVAFFPPPRTFECTHTYIKKYIHT
jgi:hypothetical protein